MVQKASGARDHHAARKTEVGRTGARFGPPGQWRQPPARDGADEVLPEPPTPDSAVGLTGARFGGAPRKRRRGAPPPPEQVEPRPREPAVPDPVDSAPAPPDPAEPTAAETTDEHHWSDDYADWLARPESHALVRPYAWTGGRTRTQRDLAIEALVRTTDPGAPPTWEHRAITDLCAVPRSVAEVAALLAVPLGVARVLIGDLADAGVLRVHQTAGGALDVAMMNRVLAGLRRL